MKISRFIVLLLVNACCGAVVLASGSGRKYTVDTSIGQSLASLRRRFEAPAPKTVLPKAQTDDSADAFFANMAGFVQEEEQESQQLINEIKSGASVARISELLHSGGVGPNVKDGNGLTPLMWATRLNRPDIVDLLLAQGADVNARCNVVYKYRESALSIAAKLNNFIIAKKLLLAGATIIDTIFDHMLFYYSPNTPPYYDANDKLAAYGDYWADENIERDDQERIIDLEISEKMRKMLDDFEILHKLSDAVDKEVAAEPKMEDYFALTGDQAIVFDQDEVALNQFYTDLENYLLGKVYKAFRAYLVEDNTRPLIDFFCNEIFARQGLVLVLFHIFRENDLRLDLFLEFISRDLKDHMTEEEKEKLSALIELEERIYQTPFVSKIQAAWGAHASSGNRAKNVEDYKKRMEMKRLPFADEDEIDA